MNHNGKTIRHFRNAKKLTQTELASGIVSKNFLSTYERGENNISDDSFFKILEKMNVTLPEFEKFYLKGKETQDTFLSQLSLAVQQENLELLEYLLTKEKKLVKKDHNIRHKHNKMLIRNYINQITGIPVERDSMNAIKDYLIEMEDWGSYEVGLFQHAVNFVTPEIRSQLVQMTLKKSQQFRHMTEYLEQLSAVLLKIFSKDLEEERWPDAFEVEEVLEELLNKQLLFYEQLQVMFYKGLLQIKTGNAEEGQENCEFVIHQFYRFSEVARADEFKRVMNGYVSED